MDCKGCRVPGHKAEDCDYAQKDPKSCNCQHRETELLIINGQRVLAPKGVRPVMPK
jgi:hypothetical protein